MRRPGPSRWVWWAGCLLAVVVSIAVQRDAEGGGTADLVFAWAHEPGAGISAEEVMKAVDGLRENNNSFGKLMWDVGEKRDALEAAAEPTDPAERARHRREVKALNAVLIFMESRDPGKRLILAVDGNGEPEPEPQPEPGDEGTSDERLKVALESALEKHRDRVDDLKTDCDVLDQLRSEVGLKATDARARFSRMEADLDSIRLQDQALRSLAVGRARWCAEAERHSGRARVLVDALGRALRECPVEGDLRSAAAKATTCASDEEAAEVKRLHSGAQADVGNLQARLADVRSELSDAEEKRSVWAGSVPGPSQSKCDAHLEWILKDSTSQQAILDSYLEHTKQLEGLGAEWNAHKSTIPKSEDITDEIREWLKIFDGDPDTARYLSSEFGKIQSGYASPIYRWNDGVRLLEKDLAAIGPDARRRRQSIVSGALDACAETEKIDLSDCPTDRTLDREIELVELELSRLSRMVVDGEKDVALAEGWRGRAGSGGGQGSGRSGPDPTPTPPPGPSAPAPTPAPAVAVPTPQPSEQGDAGGIRILGPTSVDTGRSVGFVAVSSNMQPLSGVEWASSDPTALTISQGGSATGVYRGSLDVWSTTVTVYAMQGSLVGRHQVTVTDLDPVTRGVVEATSRALSGEYVDVEPSRPATRVETAISGISQGETTTVPSSPHDGLGLLDVGGEEAVEPDPPAEVPEETAGGFVPTGSTTGAWEETAPVDAVDVAQEPADGPPGQTGGPAEPAKSDICDQLRSRFAVYINSNFQLAQSVALQAQVAGCPTASQMMMLANQSLAAEQELARQHRNERNKQLAQTFQGLTQEALRLKQLQEQQHAEDRKDQIRALEKNRVGSPESEQPLPKQDRTIGWINTTPQSEFHPPAGGGGGNGGSGSSGDNGAGGALDDNGSDGAPSGGGTGGGSWEECRNRYCSMCADDQVFLGEAADDPACTSCATRHKALIEQCVSGGSGSGGGGAGGGIWRSASEWRSGVRGGGAPENTHCLVGVNWEDNPEYAVACDGASASASVALSRGGFNSIAYGPATGERCRQWLRDRGVPGW